MCGAVSFTLVFVRGSEGCIVPAPPAPPPAAPVSTGRDTVQLAQTAAVRLSV